MLEVFTKLTIIFALMSPGSTLERGKIVSASGSAVANQNYFDLSTGNFTQNWSNTGLITANDDWSGVQSVEGFLGQDITTTTGVDPQTLLTTSTLPNDLDVIANQSSPNTLTSGGVAEFDGISNPTIALQGSGTADAPHVIFYLNTTGRQNIQISYNLRDIDGSNDNAVQPVALQYRVGTTGNFTNVPAGFVPDATTGPGEATLVTPVNVTLPAEVNNQAQVQVRIITSNAVGSDEWVGIDDIVISSSPIANSGSVQLAFSNLSIPESGGIVPVALSRTGGSSGAASVNLSTANGTATGGASCGTAGVDFISQTNVTVNWADGDAANKIVNIPICDDTVFEGDETFTVTLSNATGATLGTPSSATITIQDNDPQPATVQFQQASFSDDESQTAAINVVRGGDLSVTATVDYSTSALSSTAGLGCGLNVDFVSNSGTLTFLPGETSKTINIQLCSDRFTEASESLQVALSNPSAGTVLGTNSTATLAINDTASEFRNPAPIGFVSGGPAQVYPSSITVSGAAGPISKIRVTLYDVSHPIDAANLDVLLVSPDGRNIILMSDAGGTNGLTTPRTITFSDDAGQVLPQNGAIQSAFYEPTSYTPGQQSFPSPAPPAPYNEPGSSVGGSTTLASVFGGADPNGEWRLYVRDDNGAIISGSAGSIAGGWGIEIITQAGQAVSLSGRVRTVNGSGILRAAVIISGGNLPQPVITYTNNFGNYNFQGLVSGQSYSVQVVQSKFAFSPSLFNFTLTGSLQGGDIISSTSP